MKHLMILTDSAEQRGLMWLFWLEMITKKAPESQDWISTPGRGCRNGWVEVRKSKRREKAMDKRRE